MRQPSTKWHPNVNIVFYRPLFGDEHCGHKYPSCYKHKKVIIKPYEVVLIAKKYPKPHILTGKGQLVKADEYIHKGRHFKAKLYRLGHEIDNLKTHIK